MNASDYIAVTALLISVLSALYARWSALESKRANDLSLHVHKIAIYEEVVSFSDCFRGIFTVPTRERLDVFGKKAVQRAEIFLSEEVFRQLQEIYAHCDESEVWLQLANREENHSDDVPSELEVRSEYKSVLNLLIPVIHEIKKEIKLDNE